MFSLFLTAYFYVFFLFFSLFLSFFVSFLIIELTLNKCNMEGTLDNVLNFHFTCLWDAPTVKLRTKL